MLIPPNPQITPIHLPNPPKAPILLPQNNPTPQHKIMRKNNPQLSIPLIIREHKLKLLNIQHISQKFLLSFLTYQLRILR